MILYGLKTCDTCRKALKSLSGAELVDLRDSPVPAAVLETALARFGARLVNTRSITWRGLSQSERAAAPLDLIRAHPAVMKRTLIVAGEAMWLGWDAEVQRETGAA